MVMTLALLVYSVAQRRLRQQLARHNETIPNQINQPTTSDLTVGVSSVGRDPPCPGDGPRSGPGPDQGLNEVKIKILRLFGEQVCHVYQLPSG